jgi:hypothetical protein
LVSETSYGIPCLCVTLTVCNSRCHKLPMSNGRREIMPDSASAALTMPVPAAAKQIGILQGYLLYEIEKNGIFSQEGT